MVLKDLDDDEIIHGLLSHDLKILDAIYAQCFPMVRKLVTQYMGTEEDAKDVFQEGIIAVLERATSEKLILRHSFTTYFYGVCRNLWGMTLRKKHHKKIPLDEIREKFAEDSFAMLETDITQGQRMVLLKKHYKQLPDDCRDILQMFWEGKSMKEIAQKLDLTPGYTKKRKFLCKRKLIDSIKKDPLYFELLP